MNIYQTSNSGPCPSVTLLPIPSNFTHTKSSIYMRLPYIIYIDAIFRVPVYHRLSVSCQSKYKVRIFKRETSTWHITSALMPATKTKSTINIMVILFHSTSTHMDRKKWFRKNIVFSPQNAIELIRHAVDKFSLEKKTLDFFYSS